MTIRQRAAIPKSSDMVVSKDMYNGDKPHPSPPNFNTQQDEELTWKSLMPAIAVSILVSIAAYYACGNIEMMEDILVCCVRTIVQLTLLASLLSPLFKLVDGQQTKVKSTKYNTAPLLVLGYVFFFMLPLAAWEASSRSKLTLHPMGINNSLLFNNNIVLVIVMVSLLTAVSLMGAIALFVIVKPKPWYSPRHVIPLCGMLFNNALSAISVCLDILFSELQSKQRDTIELMISFGSDPWSATRPILRSVLSSSMKPQINSMNVIGLVAIPGMMTGNLLAGSSPHKAAKYQMMIMILILGGNFISTAMTTELLLWNVFEKGTLRDDWIDNNDSLRVSQLISSMVPWKSQSSIGGTKQDSKSTLDSSLGSSDVKLTSDRELTKSDNPFFSLSLKEGSFANSKRKMTADFTVPNNGDIAILEGVSGVGKSTLLKAIAMLNSGMRFSASASSMAVSLQGKDRDSYLPQEWRKQVLYVPQQISSTLGGTPESFIQFIAPFYPQMTLEALMLQTAKYLTVFDCANILEQSWSELSGGEAQRALLSVALALKPKIILADESTSALPNDMKLKVEEEMKRSGATIIMVSHDEEQMKRLGTVRLSLAAV